MINQSNCSHCEAPVTEVEPWVNTSTHEPIHDECRDAAYQESIKNNMTLRVIYQRIKL